MIPSSQPMPAQRSQSRHESPLRMLLRSRLMTAIKAIHLLLFFGSVGFWILGRMYYAGLLEPKLSEPWPVLDCIYMTVITFSTIGYGEVFPLEGLIVARLYTIGLILCGMLLVGYSVSSATAFFVNGDLQRLLLRRRTMKAIKRLKGHFILCGCGVTGKVILQELLDAGQHVVVIDLHQSQVGDYVDHPQVHPVFGDATTDEVLAEAGLDRAGGLAAALPNDKDNLFLIISVRQLRPDVRIVSLATDMAVTQKLKRAGADAVVSASFIGGLRLASELLRPAVVSFLDLMLRKSDSPVRFAEVEVGQEWSGKSLADLKVHEKTGLPVLAIKPRGSEEFTFNPSSDAPIEEGTVLVTMGEIARVNELDQLVGDPDGAHFVGGGGDDAEASAD